GRRGRGRLAEPITFEGSHLQEPGQVGRGPGGLERRLLHDRLRGRSGKLGEQALDPEGLLLSGRDEQLAGRGTREFLEERLRSGRRERVELSGGAVQQRRAI